MDVGEIMGKAGLMAMAHVKGQGQQDVSDVAMLVSHLAAHIQILQKQVADLTLAVTTHKGA